MRDLIYCFIDIEVDGPSPGTNSMLAFACVACSKSGEEIAAFERNLEPLKAASADAETLKWWKSQPQAWAYIRRNPEPPQQAMTNFCGWISTLPGDPVLAAHPLIFDGCWLDWYLRKFTTNRAFGGPFPGDCPFVGAGIDVPSFVQAAIGLPYSRHRPNYPPELLDGIEHTHKPIDDARGHAALYFNAKRRAGPNKAP